MRQGAPTTLERSPSLDLGLSESINWVSSESWILYLVSNVDPDPVNQTVQNAAWVAIGPLPLRLRVAHVRRTVFNRMIRDCSALSAVRRCVCVTVMLSVVRKRTEDDLKVLQGLLPICSYCKKIRDVDGYWEQIERYIAARSEADFTHGMCPDCGVKHFPEAFTGPVPV